MSVSGVVRMVVVVVATWPVSLPMLAYYRLVRRPDVIEANPALGGDE